MCDAAPIQVCVEGHRAVLHPGQVYEVRRSAPDAQGQTTSWMGAAAKLHGTFVIAAGKGSYDAANLEATKDRQPLEMVAMHGYGSMWPMGAMMVGWLLLTALIVGLVVWAVVGLAQPRRADVSESARRILAERYARGELDADEYSARAAALR